MNLLEQFRKRKTVISIERGIVRRLASLVHSDRPADDVVIEFDVCGHARKREEVERQIAVWCGFVLQFEKFGPGGGWPCWTVKFFRRESAHAFLQAIGVLKQGQTLADYEVKL
jgi:hypothetical protein